jgi:hypothetical protein
METAASYVVPGAILGSRLVILPVVLRTFPKTL